MIETEIGGEMAAEDKSPHIEQIFAYIRQFQDASVEILSSRLGLTPQLVRLIRYQMAKVSKNDLTTQPFSFMRPKYRQKSYDLSPAKIFIEESDEPPKLEDLMKSLESECFGPSFYEDFERKLLEKGFKMAYP